MPKVIINTNSDGPAIERNIVNSIIDSLTPMLSLPKGVRIDYYGETQVAHQPGSAVDDDKQQVRLSSDGKITVDVNDEYDEDSLIAEAIHEIEEPPHWVDPSLQFMLRPIRTKALMQLSFTYRAPTKSAANRFRNNIKMLATSGREMHLHELKYHIPIPLEFVILSGIIHKLRETQGGYGDTFGKYLKDHTVANLTTVTVNGNKQRLVSAERMATAQGWFESIVTNKPERDDGYGTWTVSFDYYVSYQRVIGWSLDYPIMVHNQLLPPNVHDYEPSYHIDNLNANMGVLRHNAHTMERLYTKANPDISGARVPYFDTWYTRNKPHSTIALMTVLVGLDNDNLTSVMNFSQVDPYEFNEDVYKFMLDEAPYMTSRYKSFFQLDLYEGDYLLEPGNLRATNVNGELVVTYNKPLDIRKQYHVRLSVVIEHALLDERAKDAMSEHGLGSWEIIKDLGDEGGTQWGRPPIWDKPESWFPGDNKWDDGPNFIDMPDGPYLPGKVIEDILDQVKDGLLGGGEAITGIDLDIMNRYVQFFTVIVNKREVV